MVREHPLTMAEKECAMSHLCCQECDYTIEDLFDLVFPSDTETKGHLCMIYTCFLDDSKDRDQEKVAVSAGFVADKENWGRLRAIWKGVLNRRGLAYFKSSEYYSLSGEFARFRTGAYPRPTGREAAQEIRAELQAKLGECENIFGIGIMVVLEDFNKVLSRPESDGVIPPNPYHIAFNSVMHQTANLVRSWPGRNKVAFVHDDGSDFDSLRASYQYFKEKNPKSAKMLAGFMPLDDKDHP